MWDIACRSTELGGRLLRIVRHGVPYVVFRSGSRVVALEDRCPHRNIPLSEGRLVAHDGAEPQLVCRYHGWRFGPDGKCLAIPGLVHERIPRGCDASVLPAHEEGGFVWICPQPEASASPGTPSEMMGREGYSEMTYSHVFSGNVSNVAENILDVLHTSFLHRGWFRTGHRNRVTVEVRQWAGTAEANYVGEPRPGGLMGRLLAPSGGDVYHADRFIYPNLAQVEYRLGKTSHVVVTSFLSEAGPEQTHMFTKALFKLPMPSGLIKTLFMPAAKKVVMQDVDVLQSQARNVKAFSGERFASTELDVLRSAIVRLRKYGPATDVITRAQAEVYRIEAEL